MKLTSSRPAVSRRTFLIGSSAGIATGALSMPFVARAQTETTLRAAHIESTESATHKGYVAFADKVKEATGGSVEIQVFPAGQLGNLRDLYEGLSLGSVDLTSSGPDYTANIAPVMVTAALYYSYQSDEHADRAFEGEFSERLSHALAAQANMRILAWGELGWRSVFNTVRPIVGPGDFSGLKIRVPEAQLHILPMQALGATPSPIPYSDVYTSMQTGVVDGAEGTPAAVIQQKFNEVSNYFSLTRHLYNPIHVVISGGAYDKLSSEQQDAVTQAARDVFREQRAQSRLDNEAGIAQLVEGGLSVNDDVDAEAIRAVVEPTWSELVDGLGDDGRQLVRLLQDAA
jgi:tripartite ATP-independent transporter DctP family solute receptor